MPGDRRERIERDVRCVEKLRTGGFAGPEYEIFINDLCRETLKQLKGLLRTGDLARLSRARFREHGIRLFVAEQDLDALRSSMEDRDELAVNILLAALRGFHRNALVKGRWNPRHSGKSGRGPACLQSYFIGLCIWEFRQEYMRWHKDRQRRFEAHAALLDPEDFLSQLAAPVELSDPEALAIGSSVLKLLSTSSAQTRAVVALIVQGYSHSEIADRLHIKPRAAEGCLYRFRRKVREAAYRGQLTIPEVYLAGRGSAR